ncbi:MAG: hypothetical protein JKY65_29740 [Planctomycetes bacterium]|nr:hypothetical protein [Planctomycetota bacterium]
MPASSGEQTLPSIRVEVLQGTGQIRSGSVEQLGDPGYVVALVAHDLVEVRPPSILKPLGGIGLLGERELRMRSTGLGVKVLVGLAPELHYEGLAAIRLKEGLVVALDQARGLPVLEFRSGERLLLEEVPVPILIENPTIVIDGYKAVVKFLGGIEAKLRKAGAHGAVAFVTRHDDHLETRKNAKATVQLRLENVELVLDDGRELRIQPKAPPVDARVSDAKGTLFLSMPGAPSLGLRPELALTVLATNEGEFVILDKDRISPERLEQQGLAYGFDDDALLIDSERILDLLDVPIADSPSGP